MNRVNRVREEHGYNVNDWYTASRESKTLSEMSEDIHMYAYTDDQQSNYAHATESSSQSQGSGRNWPSPRHEPSYQKMQPQRLQPMYSNSPQQNTANSNGLKPANGNYPAAPYAREISQYSSTFGTSRRNIGDDQSIASSNLYAHQPSSGLNSAIYTQDPIPMQQHTPYSKHSENPNSSQHSKLVVLTDLPKGVELEDPRTYESRPVTASTIGSAQPLNASYSGDLYSKHSRQHLVTSHGNLSARDEKRYPDLVSPPSAYTPPDPPTASSTQYSNMTQVSRNKSVKDRYKARSAGGDSCMGECCEGCCGACMRGACCSVCCCMGPIITTIIVVLVMVGIALALYFNWDRIIDAVQGTSNGDSSADSTAAAAATPAAARELAMHIAALVRRSS
ncbi:hypothetical protein IWW36_001894 [Coemansia brasiliensis]|uniref:Uncharacterized protein n=1 Tax=Coemansia brasiliensis TaxID=2650707 RepID=A0A9W8I891_9FUNG|nr:hypothetical protein IWW36_001894 [Coemansia brasiliensis]